MGDFSKRDHNLVDWSKSRVFYLAHHRFRLKKTHVAVPFRRSSRRVTRCGIVIYYDRDKGYDWTRLSKEVPFGLEQVTCNDCKRRLNDELVERIRCRKRTR